MKLKNRFIKWEQITQYENATISINKTTSYQNAIKDWTPNFGFQYSKMKTLEANEANFIYLKAKTKHKNQWFLGFYEGGIEISHFTKSKAKAMLLMVLHNQESIFDYSKNDLIYNKLYIKPKNK